MPENYLTVVLITFWHSNTVSSSFFLYSLAGISLLGDEEFDQEEEKNACEETDKPDEGQQNANIQTDIPQFPENMSQSTPTQDFRFSTMHCCVNLSLHFDYGRVDELYSSNHLSKCRFFFPLHWQAPSNFGSYSWRFFSIGVMHNSQKLWHSTSSMW